MRAYDFIDEVLRSVSLPQQYKQTLQTIHGILSPVHSDEQLRAIIKRLKVVREPFGELRTVLRFTRSDNTGGDRCRPLTVDLRLARECKQRLRKLTMRLENAADDLADQSRAKDARIVLANLDKYRDGLHGRLLNVKAGNCKQVLVPRTNHIAEQHFRRLKRKWRRRLGTAKLTRRQQAARPEERLVANLENSQYIDAVYAGNLATLPERFAKHYASVIEARQSPQESNDEQSMHTPKKTIRAENLFSKMEQIISALAVCLLEA